jgi:squalene-hopene/tetraprenyl-beta-curcumene cyclase
VIRVLLLTSFLLLAGRPLPAQDTAPWNPEAAGRYLDSRMAWWIKWPVSARDHQTFCISCHTALPFALARPALRADLREQGPSSNEQRVIENVTKRVRLWGEVEPFYPDAQRGVPKTAESRGTESILNALILAWSEPKNDDARLALNNMWALQLTTGEAAGAWNWLQFHNSPWEGDSQYFGATLAALAAGTAGDYPSGAQLLRDYLVRNQESQILYSRMMLLWASTKWAALLTAAQQKAIIDAALSKQEADGGFSLSKFVGDWKRHDNTPLETKSDGLATGLVALVSQEMGMPSSQPQLQRALAWLNHNQDKTEGRWYAYSLNKQRDLSSDAGRFMSDAATAYAVLALEQSNSKPAISRASR